MALEEFASLEGREAFDNPAAYLMKIVPRSISAEENPFEKFSTKACEPEILPPRRLEDVKRERSPSVEAALALVRRRSSLSTRRSGGASSARSFRKIRRASTRSRGAGGVW